MNDEALFAVAHSIAVRDPSRLSALPSVAKLGFAIGATRTGAQSFFLEAIKHHVYAGDTLLHVAAAAYDVAAATELLRAGANVRARNRRGAEPIHYAADGIPGHETWDPEAQATIVRLLLESGADPNAFDKDGVGPLHRAVRTRSTGAVAALLAGGADPRLRSGRGSTPQELAAKTTGRGGSGSSAARAEQAAILRLLER